MQLSRTDEYCDCGALQHAVEHPDIPIVFDVGLNEFHITFGGGGTLMLRHCFFCGGKAPESLRGRLFATVTDAEQHRLTDLTASLKTIDAVLATLGTPDDDNDAGMTFITPEKDGEPSNIKVYRVLTYRNLSETADILVTVYPPDQVGITFQGKYIGPNQRD